MPNLVEEYQKNYSDMPFEDFAAKVHDKYYNDMTFEDFAMKAGIWKQPENAGRGTRDQRESMNERDMDIASRVGQLRQHVSDGNIALQSGVPFSDELSSAVGAPRGLFNGNGVGEEYQRQMEAEAEARRQVEEAMPTASPLLRFAGGVGSMGGPAGMGKAVAGQLVKPAPGLAAQLVQGMKQGTVVGGVTGAGEGQGMDRLWNAEKGALYGGATGGAIPVAAATVGGLVRAGRAVASPATTSVANRIMPKDQATGLVAEALRRDNLAPGAALDKLSAMERSAPDAVLADVGGASTRRLTRAAVNTPGAQTEEILSTLNARNLSQPDRIVNAVSDVLDNPTNFGKTVDRLAAEREHLAGPLYREAFKANQPVNVNSVVKYIDSKVSPGISGMANPAADLRPDGITATLDRLRTYFQTASSQRVNLQQLHQIKTEMDSMIGVAKAAGDGTKARAILGVKNRLLASMDLASPTYRKARQLFSGTHDLQDALEVGTNVFKMTPDAIKAEIAGMSAAQKEMVQLGVAKAVRDKINGVADGRDIVKSVFGNQNVRDAVKAGFQNDQAFRKMQATLLRETSMRKTYDAAVGNSTSAAQIADMLGMKGGVGQDVFSQLMEGHPIKAAATAVRQAFLGERGINEKVANELGSLLLSKDPAKVAAAIRAMEGKQALLEKIKAGMANLQLAAGRANASEGGRRLATGPRPSSPQLQRPISNLLLAQ